MPRLSDGNDIQPRSDQQTAIVLEDLDSLDSMVTQAEINLIAHYFQELLKDLGKGPTP